MSRQINTRSWKGSYNSKESSLQQLSPYIGKLKTGMAGALLQAFSSPGSIVLDPFSGSGVVPLQAALLDRIAWANDLNPYAHVLTKGKLTAPPSKDEAIARAEGLLANVDKNKANVDLRRVPQWVRNFFHTETLREVIVAFKHARSNSDYFLLACLLGILHHQRPGFLSFPSSHLVPYLRDKKFPRSKFTELYEYRDLRSRLLSKIDRAYRNPMLPNNWGQHLSRVSKANAKRLSIAPKSVDTIITSPPYFGALSYARDNRLRLWFLGESDWETVDKKLTSKTSTYLKEMTKCLSEMHRVLKPGGFCVLILGDVYMNGKTKNTAKAITRLATSSDTHRFTEINTYTSAIPEDRRSRRGTRTTKIERILVLQK